MTVIDDEFETPDDLYTELCTVYELNPRLDVACKYDIELGKDNSKCYESIYDSLNQEWVGAKGNKLDVWCNPPHTKTKQFVKKAYEQWKKHNINIMMIIPANSVCTEYAKKYIYKNAKCYPIFGRIRFWKDGYPSKFPSRNSYFVVIWRKK